MKKVIKIEGEKIMIGTEDGSIESYPLSDGTRNLSVGDEVDIFKNGDEVIMTKKPAPSSPTPQYQLNTKRFNKHVFVWVFTFLIGGLGIDRFMRGQVGLGILKLLTGGGIGVWALIDWLIALVKAYGSAFGTGEEIEFINGKYAR